MKKQLLSVLLGLACAVSAYAVPAMKGSAKVTQPDGTTVTVSLHGDEFFHYTTTIDGYTVERNDAGYYVYMMKVGEALVQSEQVAHDASLRSVEETKFLESIETNLVATEAVEKAQAVRTQTDEETAESGLLTRPKVYDYKNFRGLVILAEFNDCSFTRTDANEIFTNMINQKDYKGVPSTDGTTITPYTGSVRDYFYDNSMGQFEPEFDVVGPVKINYSKYYPNGSSNRSVIMKAVINAADELVDFSKYDRDGDGYVDMFYVIFAGHGSNYQGNNSGLIWPHKSAIYVRKDGVYTGTYACSTEMYGLESMTVIDGIGTICHEFSHVLGLKDLYDTDYEGSGGQSDHPGDWSVMSGGSYFNYSRTPAGYTLFERYASGFTTPTTITADGEYKLRSVAEYNEGYRINSAVDNEYFLFENRRKAGWDAYLPGSGMLVFRVDSTNTSVWSNNTINCNPSHNYFELVRANPTTQNGSIVESAGDPFPGTGKVSTLGNNTTPNMKSWTGKATPQTLSMIYEDSDGNIHFTVGTSEVGSTIEDFESMPVMLTDTAGVVGNFTNWNFSNAAVNSYGKFLSNGTRAVGLSNGGYCEATEISADQIESISVHVWNANSKVATMHLYVSEDRGETWTEYFESGSTSASQVKAGKSNYKLVYPIKNTKPIMFRISAEGNFGTGRVNVDDVEVSYTGSELSGVDNIIASVDENGLTVAVNGNTLYVASDSSADVEVYNASGMLVARAAAVDGVAAVELAQSGFYIVRQGNKVKKIVF